MSLDETPKGVDSPEEKTGTGITRKDFLKGAALAVLGAAVPTNAMAAASGKSGSKGTHASGKKSKRPYNTYDADVIVVGGGIAGMAAARPFGNAGTISPPWPGI
jgi:hypothetical protein